MTFFFSAFALSSAEEAADLEPGFFVGLSLEGADLLTPSSSRDDLTTSAQSPFPPEPLALVLAEVPVEKESEPFPFAAAAVSVV